MGYTCILVLDHLYDEPLKPPKNIEVKTEMTSHYLVTDIPLVQSRFLNVFSYVTIGYLTILGVVRIEFVIFFPIIEKCCLL